MKLSLIVEKSGTLSAMNGIDTFQTPFLIDFLIIFFAAIFLELHVHRASFSFFY